MKGSTQPARRKTPSYRRQSRSDGQDLAFVEIAGQRHYLGGYDTPASREKYHRMIAEWEASGSVRCGASKDISIVELASLYMKWANIYYVKDGKPTTEVKNIGLAMRPLKHLYGRLPAQEFGPKALKTVRQAMVESGVCRRYINRQTGLIKRMFRWAVEEELIPPGIYHGVQAVRGLSFGRCNARESDPVKPAPLELVEPIKSHVSRQVAAMIDMQLLTGARPGEVVIMRPCDIDRDSPIWVYKPNDHKTRHRGHDRLIFIGPRAQEVLAPFLLRSAEAYCFSPAEAEETRRRNNHNHRTTPESCGNSVGTNRKDDPQCSPGERYTQDSYRRAIDRGIAKAFPLPEHLSRQKNADGKMETKRQWQARLTDEQRKEIKAWRKAHHWHPHQLRHNAGTNARKADNLEAAQVFLGHSKADVTQIYAERDMERAKQVALKIG